MSPILRAYTGWAVLLGGAGVLVAPLAHASTLHVPLQYPTIQAGIDAAVSGDVVLVAPGTYTEPETRTITLGGSPFQATCMVFLKDGVQVVSEEGPEKTILDPTGANFVGASWVAVGGLHHSGETLLQGFTITGSPAGYSGLRYQNSTGKLTIRECHFRDLDAGPIHGGGGVSSLSASVDLIGCRFTNCLASYGGAVYVVYFDLLVENCWFVNCHSSSGAIEVYLDYDFPGHSMRVFNSSFLRNTGDGGCGAITTSGNHYTTTVQGCYFEANSADTGGGGAVGGGSGFAAYVIDNVFVRNSNTGSNNWGGALAVAGYGLVVRNNTFYENSQVPMECGGAAMNVTSTGTNLRLDNNLFVGNYGAEALRLPSSVYIFSRSCNVFWDNPDGEICGVPLAETDRIVDPEFCDSESDDFTLSAGSPCLPENESNCGLVGALGQGCGAVSVEKLSWGGIKSLYR